MNVASLELCKELYELSGWDGSYFNHYYDRSKDHSIVYSLKGALAQSDSVPAYDLGYLLRKLPRYVAFEVDDVISATHTNQEHKDFVEFGDTPEDAACKLAIELWKQGILHV